jgi:hypothetical protein
MNLVEYPFASLWKNTEPGTEILHEWETEHPVTGRTLKAFWRVTGDPKLGLPTPSDEQVYLALMELTEETGLLSPSVHFTRHDLLRRLNWPVDQHYYNLLRDAFTRLGAVFITSQNAFWDAKARSFKTIGFNLIDNFEILEERRGRKRKDSLEALAQPSLPVSFFKWNDVLFESFQSGYIRAIDLDFALSLRSSIALRLYRYLDKKSYDGRREFEVELSVLCERHLGMKPCRYPSKFKERLLPAHDELLARRFLSGVRYEAMSTKKGEKVCYTFAERCDVGLPTPENSTPAAPFEDWQDEAEEAGEDSDVEAGGRDVQPTLHAPGGQVQVLADDEKHSLLVRMLELKVAPVVAHDLLQSVQASALREQLDCLEDRMPKDPAAVFVKATREGWEPPRAFINRRDAVLRARQVRQERDRAASQARSSQEARKQEESALEDAAALEASQLDALWESLDEAGQGRIQAQARERLGVLGMAGRAPSALEAMRRTLLRAMLAERQEK